MAATEPRDVYQGRLLEKGERVAEFPMLPSLASTTHLRQPPAVSILHPPSFLRRDEYPIRTLLRRDFSEPSFIRLLRTAIGLNAIPFRARGSVTDFARRPPPPTSPVPVHLTFSRSFSDFLSPFIRARAVDWSRCQRGITFLHGYI